MQKSFNNNNVLFYGLFLQIGAHSWLQSKEQNTIKTNLCEHACMHVCMYTCMYTCIHARMPARMHTHYTHTHMQTTCTHTLHAHTPDTHTHTHTHQTHTHTQTHTYTTHTHTVNGELEVVRVQRWFRRCCCILPLLQMSSVSADCGVVHSMPVHLVLHAWCSAQHACTSCVTWCSVQHACTSCYRVWCRASLYIWCYMYGVTHSMPVHLVLHAWCSAQHACTSGVTCMM